MEYDVLSRIKMIKKHYQKNKLILDLQLYYYDGYNIYIRIDYIKKLKIYRLSWFDLDDLSYYSIEQIESYTYLTKDMIDSIIDFLKNKEGDNEDIKLEEDQVILKIYPNNLTYTFNKYIPKNWAFIARIFIMIFNNMPRNYQELLFKLHALLMNDVTRYEYKKEFNFDLFNDDINKIFAFQIIERGKNYYEENKVKFLEKIDEERFFAVVEGTDNYLVVIKYNDENKKMQVYCSCPCEFYCKHIYAVILAIRNSNFKRFYKIYYKNPNVSLMQRVANYDYQLCMGIIEKNFLIVNNDGEIELIPIFDSNGKCNWQVLEDDEDMSLTRLLQDIIRN